MPDENMMDFLAMNALADHSSQGHGHLLHAAFHFLITRLTHEQLSVDILTRERLDELTSESWAVFVESALVSYRTWLAEVGGAPPAELLDSILAQSRQDFQVVVDDLIEHLSGFGIL